MLNSAKLDRRQRVPEISFTNGNVTASRPSRNAVMSRVNPARRRRSRWQVSSRSGTEARSVRPCSPMTPQRWLMMKTTRSAMQVGIGATRVTKPTYNTIVGYGKLILYQRSINRGRTAERADAAASGGPGIPNCGGGVGLRGRRSVRV
jgi:hypothetical protein